MAELVKGQLQVGITRYIREKVSKRLGTHSYNLYIDFQFLHFESKFLKQFHSFSRKRRLFIAKLKPKNS